ncbi:MAG TPA: histidine kinase [Clostridia bacterium]|nr:histidine kinase [Clostridia bacterium]
MGSEFAVTNMIFLIITLIIVYCIFKSIKLFLHFKYWFVHYTIRDLLNNMDQSVLILDEKNNIIKYNQSLARNFPELIKLKPCNNFKGVIGFLDKNALPSLGKQNVISAIETGEKIYSGEIEFYRSAPKYYSIQVRPIFTRSMTVKGKIIILNDTTIHKNMIQEVNEKNAELSAMIDQLNEYSFLAEALAIEHERNRMAHDLHDTLGQSMTMINTLLKVCIISCKKDDAIRDKLSEALNISKKGINELKRTVNGLAPHELDSKDLIATLKDLISDFEISGLKVELSVNCPPDVFKKGHSLFIFRLCQEALTNSLRHGEAKQSVINIQAYGGSIKVFISDDGHGAKTIIKGMGLKGMEQRINDLGGSIKYGFGDKIGFNIFAEIPYITNAEKNELLGSRHKKTAVMAELSGAEG